MDIQALLPVLQEIMDKEMKKTDALSEQLVGIGETTVNLSQNAVEIRKQTQENDARLQEILVEQRRVTETFTALKDQLSAEYIDTSALQELQNAFQSSLRTVYETHQTDTDELKALLAQTESENVENYNKVLQLIEQIHQLIAKDPHKEGITKLTDAITSVHNDIDRLEKEHQIQQQEHNEQMKVLLDELNKLQDVFATCLTVAQENKEMIAKVFSRLDIVESRLEILASEER